MKIRFEKLLEMVKEVPFFSTLDDAYLSDFLTFINLRHFQKNELICKEGEYEENFCVIISGSVRVLVKNNKGINVKKAVLKAKETFGEIAALHRHKRTATIISNEASKILYIDKKALFALLDYSKEIKVKIDKIYRQNLLKTQLSKVKIFEGLPLPFFEELIKNVELATYQKDEVVISYGEEAKNFYIILFGFAKVLIPRVNQDNIQSTEKTEESFSPKMLRDRENFKIAAYLPPGHYFGEIGLIEKKKRTATVTSLTRLELVKIDQTTFYSLLNKYCDVKNMLQKVMAERIRKDLELSREESYGSMMDWIVSSDIIQSDAVLLIDLNKCILCENCIDTCKKLFGTSRLSFDGLKYNNNFIPASCRHCQDPVCLEGCPTGAIQRDFSGEVYHHSYCIGCKNCLNKCPFKNIIMTPRKEKRYKPRLTLTRLFFRSAWKSSLRGTPIDIIGKKHETPVGSPGKKPVRREDSPLVATKCDNCKGLPYLGCVKNCPKGAAQRVNPREYFKELIPV